MDSDVISLQATGPSSSRRSDGADDPTRGTGASIQVYLLIPAVKLINALQETDAKTRGN
jgi:hypothetical protein